MSSRKQWINSFPFNFTNHSVRMCDMAFESEISMQYYFHPLLSRFGVGIAFNISKEICWIPFSTSVTMSDGYKAHHRIPALPWKARTRGLYRTERLWPRSLWPEQLTQSDPSCGRSPLTPMSGLTDFTWSGGPTEELCCGNTAIWMHKSRSFSTTSQLMHEQKTNK